MTEATVTLRKPIADTIRDGHPWIYRDAVEITDSLAPGTVTRVLDRDRTFVARGIADEGPIAVRVFTLRDESLGESLLASRFARAARLRDRVVPARTDAYRLVNGEGDLVPGFVCDVYGTCAVLKTDGAGAMAWQSVAARVIEPVLRARGVTGLLVRTGGRASGGDGPKSVLAWGESPSREPIAVHEHGMTLLVDVWEGQKTGLFLDQRESRKRVNLLADRARVLNLYAYTGGFSVAAGLGGAVSVETVDVAAPAIAFAELTWRANGLDAARHRAVCADVPAHLAQLAKQRARYDLVIADPPSFAPSERALDAALKSYRALHASALAVVAPGGMYLAASCSSHVDARAFEGTVHEGARRAKRVLQRLDSWGAPADHPRLPAFGEGDYLKCGLWAVG